MAQLQHLVKAAVTVVKTVLTWMQLLYYVMFPCPLSGM